MAKQSDLFDQVGCFRGWKLTKTVNKPNFYRKKLNSIHVVRFESTGGAVIGEGCKKKVLTKIVFKSLYIGFWFVRPPHNYKRWIAKQNITILFKRICMTLYHLSPNQSCHFDEVTHSDECHAWSALISFLPWKHLRTHLDHEWECEREKCEWLRNRSQRTAIAKENPP